MYIFLNNQVRVSSIWFSINRKNNKHKITSIHFLLFYIKGAYISAVQCLVLQCYFVKI